MSAQTAGKIIGHLVTLIQKLWSANARRVWYLIWASIVILAVPPITQYWLSHVQIPEIPISAIIGMAVAAFFMLAFAGAMAVLLAFVQRLSVAPNVMNFALPKTSPQNVKATGGDFIHTSDEALRDREDLEILKSKGFLQETDVAGLASEIGYATLERTRGRTE